MAEGPVQLSGNCKETYSLLQRLEDIEEFLQEQPETHEARTPAAPEPQLYMPLSVHGEDSQHESIQNQVMTPLKPTMMNSACSNIPGTVLDQNSTTLPVKAFDMPPRELSAPFFMDQKVTSFDQRKPTAASCMIPVTENPKTSFTDCQKTTITANNMTISNAGSQMKTLSEEQTFYRGQMTFSGDQTHYGNRMTFGGNHTRYGSQMTFSGDQTHYGNRMTFGGNHTRYGSRMTFSGDQTHSGNRMTFGGNHTRYGSQMQTLYGGQMTTLTDDHTLYGSHMMPCQSSSLPYPGFLYFSNSHLTQGQSQRSQFQNNVDILKPYICTYQDCGKSYSKRFHLQVHERKHTGERPYKCDVKGCTWKFARSDELNRHSRKHSGERPYQCTSCDRNFTRSDHLKQHQRVHSR
ncbi:Kruppel-like factor 18 [Molossus molossus]|uniref:Kruppel-like factor 18 n=1 Tax=Molossus molossus TaxID=27622 RepID=UPI0017477363|nr:Kruppel-like factor 18 [Molossus molossus]